jgi:hypothetical protein
MYQSLPQGTYSSLVVISPGSPSHRPNGLIIHYTYNHDTVRKDEMVLIDAGCEYKYVHLPPGNSNLSSPIPAATPPT